MTCSPHQMEIRLMQAFPVVISDWMMPGLDGLELVRRIRHHNQNAYVYTILLTARSQKELWQAWKRGLMTL